MFKKSSGKIRNVEKINWLRRIFLSLNFSKKKIIIYLCLFLIICFWLFVFWSNYFRIDKIYFDEKNITQLHNIEVYQNISNTLEGRNYIKIKIFENDLILKLINNKYPFIKNISYMRLYWNKIFITLKIEQPKIIYTIWNNILIWSYNEEFFNLSSNDSILSWITVLQLPDYIEDIETIQWIYNHFSERKLIETIKIIQETIDQNTIKDYTFIPGNMLLKLKFKSWEEILFSLRKDINLQLIKLLDFKLYFRNYNQFKFFDIGSSEHIIAR